MEARRSHTIIEITILSAENLCMNGKPIRKNTNVVVHTPQSCTKFFTTTRMTEEEEEGGRSYPSWNEKFLVELPSREEATWITLEVQCKTWLGAVRSVGAARVAVSDFLGGFVAENNCLQFLSYRLWDTKRERNGVINFSVRVVKAPPPPPPPPLESEPSRSMQIGGAKRMMNMESEKNLRGFGTSASNGVVTGIPVFWNYPPNIPR